MAENTAPQLETGVVKPGRTVCVPRSNAKSFAGRDPETGEPILVPSVQEFGPNQTIRLPREEIAWLRQRGFLVDHDAKPPSRTIRSHEA
ncbi:MAG TPA: hypothetical protein VMI31_04485 [Fimbriimonadaceae bacterium]|nr:hypothetical protein [Fimbriimonadaceae bacterium]